MISDFNQLNDKINRLAELTHSLRSENANLRLHASSLAAENAELLQRIEQAHLRVSALLQKLPSSEPDEEIA